MGRQTLETTTDVHATRTRLIVRYRTYISIGLHGLLFALSLFLSFGLAYNFRYMPRWFDGLFLPLVALAVPLKLIVFAWKRASTFIVPGWEGASLYRLSWRYVGLRDLMGIIGTSYVASFCFLAVYYVLENVWRRLPAGGGLSLIDDDPDVTLRHSIFLLDWACTVGLVCMARVAVRLYYEEHARSGDQPVHARTRRLIVGAGDSGEAILRELLRMRDAGYDVIGFLDDKAPRLGSVIHGVEVIGRTAQIREVCEQHRIDEILIALPKASPKEIRRLVESCQGMNLRFRTVPAVRDLLEGNVEVSPIRPVEIEDLLGREPVQLDVQAIGEVLAHQRIAVTGAGGSIGAELCRQITRFEPERLVLIEQAENSLFEVHRELQKTHPDIDVVPYMADICDAARMRTVFGCEKPRVVYHAAAHKHVPMMELNPGEAIKNNIMGTKVVVEAAIESGVDKMVMVSTDKAVNPTSVMGCSKRVAELYVQQVGDNQHTQFVTVRFGNVLGSSGSVVPIFEAQITAGGPLTVTHPEMTRYFMTIPEAAQLVLQAGVMGRGGEIFVLDMGEPVKIVDLARDMITLSGLRPAVDVDIVFSGTRPGEKLFEELSIDGEGFSSTQHPKIAIWRKRPEDLQRICDGIDKLSAMADTATPEDIRAQLAELVLEYRPPGTHATTGAVVSESFPVPGSSPASR